MCVSNDSFIPGNSIRVVFVLACVVFARCASTASAQCAEIIPLGDLPGGASYSRAYDVSADGAVVVGVSFSSSGYEAFRWTAETGMVGLGFFPGGNFSWAYAVSHDGSVVVGSARRANFDYEAFRWTQADGMVGLGFLSPEDGPDSHAYSVSGDGLVIGGRAFSASVGQDVAFRWTQQEGMQEFGFLASGLPAHETWAISEDGSVVGGHAQWVLFPGTPPEAFRWSESEGLTSLGFLPGGFTSGAETTTDDGGVIYGSGSSSNGFEPFLWTQREGLTGLGVTPGLAFVLRGVSADATRFVGRDINYLGAIVRDVPGEDLLLHDLLVDHGVELSGWYLEDARSVSTDGTVIVGFGGNPNKDSEGWIIKLLRSIGTAGDLTGDGSVDTADIIPFVAVLVFPNQATEEELCSADVNRDGTVDGRDIQIFVDQI